MENNNEWYKKIGLNNNPFILEPLKQDIILNGTTKKEILYRIDSGSISFIEGEEGSGKTSYLKSIIDTYKGKREIIFLDCKNLDQDINIKKALLERQGFFDRLNKKLPKNMILILDNVHTMNKKNTERIKYYFDNDYIKSIVLAGNSIKESNFSESLKHRIGNRITKIKKLDKETAQQMLNSRTNYQEVIPTEKLPNILKLSKNNPKQLLKNCEVLCHNLIDENTYDSLGSLNQKQLTKELERAQERFA